MAGLLPIGLEALNVAGNAVNAQIQYNQSKRLMELQIQNQMRLNEQGQQIQLDTWNKTNYPAQIAMLKKAGLNPSLIYAKGGIGGTTGGQAGGSASMAQAPNRVPMNISNILDMKRQQEEIALISSQKAKTDAEKAEIEARTPKYATEIGKIIAETTNEEIKGKLMLVEIALKQADTDKAIQETINLKQSNQLTAEQFDSIVRMTKASAIGKEIENELNTAKINLTNTEIKAISEKLLQTWSEIDIKNVGTAQENERIRQKDEEIAIAKFKANLEASYPSLGSVTGNIVKRVVNAIREIDNKTNIYMLPTKEDKIK